MTSYQTWDMLNLAANRALPSTRISRVPVIRPELHELVWQVHDICRLRSLRHSWDGAGDLRRIAITDYESPVGRLLGKSSIHSRAISSAFDPLHYALSRLRFCARVILGLRRW